MHSGLVVLVGLLFAPLVDFWSHWGDGKAEVSGYSLVQPRYGELRRGRAILVYVTEPYSRSRFVKVDRFDPANPDQTTVLKLNHVRKFQTGLYDYSVMTSVFVDPTLDFAQLRATFTSQEWCGHVFEDARVGTSADVALQSYFEGESGRASVKGATLEDALFITLRSLATGDLDTRERKLTLLGSALQRRLKHQNAEGFETTVKFAEEPRERVVPAGTFAAHTATYRRQDGSSCDVWLEMPYPHRIVGWECSDGESAKLTGTRRLPYWQTHREGDERLLGDLGLSPMHTAP